MIWQHLLWPQATSLGVIFIGFRPTKEMLLRMYNPDFWEVILDQSDLEQIPDNRGIWFESGDDREDRYEIEDRNLDLAQSVYHSILGSLTEKQREAVMLYFEYGKTQQEISAILGMSRRAVSQHLFGITRNGKCIGGAVKKMRSLCNKTGISVES
jgi:RNA polymerase sigma factor (sigma-70 family)